MICGIKAFGSTKNFYCCRSVFLLMRNIAFGSTKNFYCCRLKQAERKARPLEVLRISTVVDPHAVKMVTTPLEVLRISTVVDPNSTRRGFFLWKY